MVVKLLHETAFWSAGNVNDSQGGFEFLFIDVMKIIL